MSFFLRCLRFLILLVIKGLRYGIYPITVHPISRENSAKDWQKTRLILILNHTSLFEFLFGSALPVSYLWRMAGHLSFPVAQETLDKPFMSFLYQCMAPKVIPLSRKRDNTWADFSNGIGPDSIVIMMPEGRMRRLNGYDKHGKAMSVRAGVAEIIPRFKHENMLLVYSGGLHHVFPPGAVIPKLFRRIHAGLETVNVDKFIADLKARSTPEELTKAIITELAERRNLHVTRINATKGVSAMGKARVQPEGKHLP